MNSTATMISAPMFFDDTQDLVDPDRCVVHERRVYELPAGKRPPRGAVPLAQAIRDEDWDGSAAPWDAGVPADSGRPPRRSPGRARSRQASRRRPRAAGSGSPDDDPSQHADAPATALLTTAAAARFLGYNSTAAVRMLVHRRRLRPFGRRGRTTMFDVADLEAYLKSGLKACTVEGALRDGGASSSNLQGGGEE